MPIIKHFPSGSDCASVGRAVASDTAVRIQSSAKFNIEHFFIYFNWDENKEKEAVNGNIFQCYHIGCNDLRTYGGGIRTHDPSLLS